MCKLKTIVVVWVTPTNSAVKNYVVDKLFPKNNLKLIATWYWLKVTRKGLPIRSLFLEKGKVPYEQFFIGRYELDSKTPFTSEPKVLVSIPSAIHSHKPYLFDLLQQYLDPNINNPRCAELFARELRPNWFSWGREPFLLNARTIN